MKSRYFMSFSAVLVMLMALSASAQMVPQTINYQGRVMQNGVAYGGTGSFKFAICDSGETTAYWSNDGTSSACSEPANDVQLPVVSGLYNVILGGMYTNMTPIPANVIPPGGAYLKVWFGDTIGSMEVLTPKQELTSVPYAMQAENAGTLQGLTPGQLGGGGEPNVVIVDQMGNGDTTTIMGGLALAAGMVPAVVKVAPGMYVESGLSVPSDVNLKCIKPRACTIDGMGMPIFYLNGSQRVRIESFRLTNFYEGVSFSGGESSIWITDNEFFMGIYGISMLSGSTPADDIYIEDNDMMEFMSAPDSAGILFNMVEWIEIEHNAIENLTGSVNTGIRILGGSDVRAYRNDITEIMCSSDSPLCGGIVTQMTQNVFLDHNSISSISAPNTCSGVSLMGGMNFVVEDNTIVYFTGTTSTGISIQMGDIILVADNKIIGISGDNAVGVKVIDSSQVRVLDNFILQVGTLSPYSAYSWGIQCQYLAGPPTMSVEYISIEDNHIKMVDNGINVDFAMWTETIPSKKDIESNSVWKGPIGLWGTGFGIVTNDIGTSLSIRKNSVRDFDNGIICQWLNPITSDTNIMWNEIENNTTTDLTVMANAGVVRAYFNTMNVYSRFGTATILNIQNFTNMGAPTP